MSAIAHEKNGNFYFIEELLDINQCFADCLGGLLSVVAKNVEVAVQPVASDLLPSLRFTKSYGLPGTWKQNNNVYNTTIDYLTSGRQKNSIFEVKIPATTVSIPDLVEIKIGTARITIKGLVNNQNVLVVKNADLVATFISPGVRGPRKLTDGDVMFNYYRVRGAEIIEMIHLACSRGQFKEVQTMLTRLIEEMNACALEVVNTPQFKELILDFEAAVAHAHPLAYNAGGRHHLIQHHRNHMDEKSNVHSNVRYGNEIQATMVKAAKEKRVQGRYHKHYVA